MIQTPPILPLSGRPIDCPVAPGTATVVCARADAWSAPWMWYQTEPNSGLGRVPFFSASAIAAWRFARSGSASNVRFCLIRSRLPRLLHSTEKGCCPGNPELSKHTSRFVPLRSVV
ncbi:hypothetical protein D3C83_41970 [compost metagenome]